MQAEKRAVLGGVATAGMTALLYVAAKAAKWEVPPPGIDALFLMSIVVGAIAGWRLFGKRWDELMAPFKDKQAPRHNVD